MSNYRDNQNPRVHSGSSAPKSIWAFAVIVTLYGMCILNGLGADFQEQSSLFAPSYACQPGDVLKVTFENMPALDYESVVSRDGWITPPHSKRIAAAGHTLQRLALEARAAALESGYPAVPAAKVRVVRYGDPTVIIVGRVSNPGRYSVTAEESVEQLLRKANDGKMPKGQIIIRRHEAVAEICGVKDAARIIAMPGDSLAVFAP